MDFFGFEIEPEESYSAEVIDYLRPEEKNNGGPTGVGQNESSFFIGTREITGPKLSVQELIVLNQ
ncbi:unnamed protein product [Leuciscus chuanchicus]